MQVKKRSTSKSGRNAHQSQSTDLATKTAHSQEQKELFKKHGLKPKQKIYTPLALSKSIFNLKPEYDKIFKHVETVLSLVSKLKPFVISKGQQSRQIYLEFKTHRMVLVNQMKLFDENLVLFTQGVKKYYKQKQSELAKNEYFMEETKIRNSETVSEFSTFASKQEYDVLRSELFDLQSVCETAMARKNALDEQLGLQQAQISKYKQLLKLSVSPSKALISYFLLMSQKRQIRLKDNHQDFRADANLEKKIKSQQEKLKIEILYNKNVLQQLLQSNKNKDQQIKRLASFVETIKDHLNQINEQYVKIKQNLVNNKQLMSSMMHTLDITSYHANFFDNFILCSDKLNEISKTISSSHTLTLGEKLRNLLAQFQNGQFRIKQLQNKIKDQERLLSQAAEEYQTVTASYIKVNNQHIDLIKSYKLVSSKVEILENQNIQFTKLIKRIDELSEDQSEDDQKQEQINLICQQTIVKELRKSQNQIKMKFLALKQQYKVSENLISKYQSQIKLKVQLIITLKSQADSIKKQLENILSEKLSLQGCILKQKQDIKCLQARIKCLQNSAILPKSQRAQLLEHITSQQSQINRLKHQSNINRESIRVLQLECSQLADAFEKNKLTIEHLQSSNKELLKKNKYLSSTVMQQQQQTNIWMDKINSKVQQIQTIHEALQQARSNCRILQNEIKIIKSQTKKYQNMLSDKEFEIAKKNRQLSSLQLCIRQKDNIIKQNFSLINKLKQDLEQNQHPSRMEKVTLLDELRSIIDDQPEVRLKVPVLEFIEPQSDSENLPLFQSQREQTIEVEDYVYHVEQVKDYTHLLEQLSSDSNSSGDKLDHLLQNFSSKKRIEQLKATVSNELQVPMQKQKLFSTRKISQILIEKPFIQMINFGEGFL